MRKKYILSKLSLSRLVGLHVELESVVKRAIEITEQDFVVVEGVRTKEQCYINYGKGRTAEQCKAKGVPAQYAQPKVAKVTWLNNPLSSRHVTGHAVDLVPYPVDWNDLNKFKKISVAMKQAAKDLGVALDWGGDWRSSKDYPHFELKG
ncbi:hypothetical protein F909_02860 [Acinetobacter sp. ANC 3929]|uniref:M15 family metallopeptidase n=1 Tax=Acinetobacter sp. ANC 3929 TaxID=1217707 RepID=UPI0002CE4757|nr:M15 family metallopeptidase [Acinetobacter sp. ANC 3929]ENW79757.1 hypothetical protein F909_02860 [Acinetobacter sp. ANC 3929]